MAATANTVARNPISLPASPPSAGADWYSCKTAISINHSGNHLISAKKMSIFANEKNQLLDKYSLSIKFKENNS